MLLSVKKSIARGYRHGCSCLFRAFCVRCRSLRLFLALSSGGTSARCCLSVLSATGFREALARRSTCVDSRRRFASASSAEAVFLQHFCSCERWMLRGVG